MEFQIQPSGECQGPVKLRREREILRLVSQGMSNREACEVVGANERTGRGWRNGRSRPTRSCSGVCGAVRAVAIRWGRRAVLDELDMRW
ncbi:helix-turn-helix domain-containing protein [Streptomyces sp. NPDC057620]|uniref:helix-turn-helix domain-containing protein n=1 Tax=Streptomyces sp. NPDC057620 TaxID=3346185 RepID=UPI00367B8CA9